MIERWLLLLGTLLSVTGLVVCWLPVMAWGRYGSGFGQVLNELNRAPLAGAAALCAVGGANIAFVAWLRSSRH